MILDYKVVFVGNLMLTKYKNIDRKIVLKLEEDVP